MKTFTDNTGRTWTLSVTVGTIKRVADPVLLVDVLFAVCKPEADAKGITDEEFGRAMAGDAIELAATALLDEIIDFFPEAKRKVFRKILDASRRFEARSKQALTELLEDPAFDEKIDQALNQLTGAHRQPDARSEEEQGGKSGRFQPVYRERKGLPESATFRSAGRLCQKVIFCLFFRQK